MNSTSDAVLDIEPDPHAPVDLDLKNPVVAALLAWLIPGAGHLYQGRPGKGLLFFLCIMGIFVAGLALGDGQVVYASFPSLEGGVRQALRRPDMRYPFLLQAGIGAPAAVALVQFALVSNDYPPLFGSSAFSPPRGPLHEQHHDDLAVRHERLKVFFELGTLYTMIAGVLNVFAIYDAYFGPAYVPAVSREKNSTS